MMYDQNGGSNQTLNAGYPSSQVPAQFFGSPLTPKNGSGSQFGGI